jgi:hypothetical protein
MVRTKSLYVVRCGQDVDGLSHRNFGLLIAYVLPGFTVLFGVSFVSPTTLSWLTSAETAEGPGVGGFLFAFIFSVGAGVTTSAVRWLLLDRFHRMTGVKRTELDLSGLEDKSHSFNRVVEDHYRYYEFYGGMLIATSFTYVVWRFQQANAALRGSDAVFIIIELVFVLASRDALQNYYGRAARVLGTIEGDVSNDKRIRPSRGKPGIDKPEDTIDEE